LPVNRGEYGAGVAVEPERRRIIANILDHIADYFWNIDVFCGSNLTHDENHSRSGTGLAGYSRHGVFFEQRIKHRIRNLVADFIGVSLGDTL
jgi:hypothetical protein